jgi:predicted enzyme related to lactoylglutathione lyase
MSEKAVKRRIGQIARHVRNIEVAKRWYIDVLHLPHLYSFGSLSFFDCDGTRLFLSEQRDETPVPNSILYFVVDDIDAACRDLQQRGVHFSSAPHLIHRHDDGTEEWMAFFEDCEGDTLALMSKRSTALS